MLQLNVNVFHQKTNLVKKNIEEIFECYKKRENSDYFSRIVEHKEISEKDYNMNVSTYITPKIEYEEINIKELNEQIEKIVIEQNELRTQIDEIVVDLEGN